MVTDNAGSTPAAAAKELNMICHDCGKDKQENEFRIRRPSVKARVCNDCLDAEAQERNEYRKMMEGKKRCLHCLVIKNVDDFRMDKEMRSAYCNQCEVRIGLVRDIGQIRILVASELNRIKKEREELVDVIPVDTFLKMKLINKPKNTLYENKLLGRNFSAGLL